MESNAATNTETKTYVILRLYDASGSHLITAGVQLSILKNEGGSLVQTRPTAMANMGANTASQHWEQS